MDPGEIEAGGLPGEIDGGLFILNPARINELTEDRIHLDGPLFGREGYREYTVAGIRIDS